LSVPFNPLLPMAVNTMTQTSNESISERLRWAREQAGLSQGQVAKLLGVHRPTISTIESGERTVKAEEVSFFSETYGVEPDWILYGDVAIPENESTRMVARELAKLSHDDLDVVLRVVRTLRRRGKPDE
jgi:transcriptional regulator with XRE-family HTH domain